jgi:RNA polymerase sigma-70 factor (ECF subfamily)
VDRGRELQLIQRAQRGDGEAFAPLYREHVQAIYRYVMTRVSDSHLAEELTGDVFTRAFKSLANYQDTGKPFLAWLYTIAHARVIDHYRRVGRRPQEVEVEEHSILSEQDVEGDVLYATALGNAKSALAQAILTLTDEQQQVLSLRFIEGLKLEEVAVIMGKNANAIKALQHRALGSLATRLERSGVDFDALLEDL